MKRLLFSTFVLMMAMAFFACSEKKESSDASTDSDEWPEMDEFHMIMAESFHPFKDSANIAPAIANAAEMNSLAEKWANAPLPGKVNNDQVKEYLANLKAGTLKFTELVATSDTTEIANALTKLHDDFHKIQEAWYGGGKEEHKHEH